jgi:hypothetical protein
VNRLTRADDKRWIVLFDSIHHVIAAEEAFQQQGVWCDLTPVPRQLSSNCGMAIEFREDDWEAARFVLNGLQVRPRSVHRPCPEGHIDMTAALL